MNMLFCFGFGYSAAHLARDLSNQGWQIGGTSTTPEGCARMKALGYRTAHFDGAAPSPDVTAAVRNATHVVISVPP
jgi:3-hydroxyisobutyrate dehydrogenase-like beta-hydroxyacid dehydrogenase